MKRIVCFAGLFLFFTVKGFCYEGAQGKYYDKGIGYSTSTNVNSSWLWYSTGHIILTYLQVSSPGVNSSIFFQQHGSTVAGGNYRSYTGSTVPFYTGFPTTEATQGEGIWLGLISVSTGSGWSFSTAGDAPAKLRLFYDFIKK